MSSQIFAGDASGSVTIQCPAVAGTNVLTLPLSNGLIPGEMIYRLNTGYTGTQLLTPQNIFGVGITLNGNTVYQFEMYIILSKTLGAVTHAVQIGFGGTATINNIQYGGPYNSSNSVAYTGGNAFISGAADWNTNTAAQTQVGGGGFTSATANFRMYFKGMVAISGAGTFIPQYSLTADPGGAWTTVLGSYIKISPVAASLGSVNIGGWA